MLDFAKRGLYLGLGLACYTKEKVETFAKEFAERSKMSEEEGRKFADYLREESVKAKAHLQETVEGMVAKASSKMPCMSRVQELEARVAALEEALGTGSTEQACEGKCPDGDATDEPAA